MPTPDFRQELIVDAKSGTVRQAGTSTSGAWIKEFKDSAQRSLYVFAKGVLGLTRLTPSLHLPIANSIQLCPPYRKLYLLPRDHLKTSLGVRGLTLHMAVQDALTNPYLPGKDGTSSRILLAAEKAGHAQNQLRWIRLQAESNVLLKGLWPQRFWENPQRQAPKWSEEALTLPRTESYPEATIETIGVGGAITGRHYDVLLKDDLVTFDAANSPVIMHEAIEWHKASRALLDSENSLEFIFGTKWANYDLYQEIIDNDPSVTVTIRFVIENTKPIFPEQFSIPRINQLQSELGGRFYLLYMNTATDPTLSEFNLDDLRYWHFDSAGDKGIHKGIQTIVYEEDSRDLAINTTEHQGMPPPLPAGTPLNRDTYNILASRNEFIRKGRSL